MSGRIMYGEQQQRYQEMLKKVKLNQTNSSHSGSLQGTRNQFHHTSSVLNNHQSNNITNNNQSHLIDLVNLPFSASNATQNSLASTQKMSDQQSIRLNNNSVAFNSQFRHLGSNSSIAGAMNPAYSICPPSTVNTTSQFSDFVHPVTTKEYLLAKYKKETNFLLENLANINVDLLKYALKYLKVVVHSSGELEHGLPLNWEAVGAVFYESFKQKYGSVMLRSPSAALSSFSISSPQISCQPADNRQYHVHGAGLPSQQQPIQQQTAFVRRGSNSTMHSISDQSRGLQTLPVHTFYEENNFQGQKSVDPQINIYPERVQSQNGNRPLNQRNFSSQQSSTSQAVMNDRDMQSENESHLSLFDSKQKKPTNICKQTLRMQSTPKPRKNTSDIKKGNGRLMDSMVVFQGNQASKNVLPSANSSGTAKGTTRAGRVVKTPKHFWKGDDIKEDEVLPPKRGRPRKNGSDHSLQDTPQDSRSGVKETPSNVLNETMTLRNNKTLEKITPPIKNNKKNNLKAIPEIQDVKESKKSNSQSQQNKTTRKEDKENASIQKIKNTKKTKNVDKSTNQIELKKNKGRNASRKNKENCIKEDDKPNRKRKSEEKKVLSLSVSKRQKVNVDEPVGRKNLTHMDHEESDDDDLFGKVSHLKKYQPFVNAGVMSPTVGMMSAKKAARADLGKETPPCKAMGQFINSSSYSAASSANLEPLADKPNKLVKRVAKAVQKQKTTKPAVHKANAVKHRASPIINSLASACITGILYESKEDSDEESASSFTDEDTDLI